MPSYGSWLKKQLRKMMEMVKSPRVFEQKEVSEVRADVIA